MFFSHVVSTNHTNLSTKSCQSFIKKTSDLCIYWWFMALCYVFWLIVCLMNQNVNWWRQLLSTTFCSPWTHQIRLRVWKCAGWIVRQGGFQLGQVMCLDRHWTWNTWDSLCATFSAESEDLCRRWPRPEVSEGFQGQHPGTAYSVMLLNNLFTYFVISETLYFNSREGMN